MRNRVLQIFRLFCLYAVLSGLTGVYVFPSQLIFSVSAENEPAVAAPQKNDLTAGKTVFEENRGQFDKKARFAARSTASTVFLTADEAVFVMQNSDKKKMTDAENPLSNPDSQKLFALRMKIVGANPDASIAGEELREHRTNYFKGADEANWQTNVPNFGAVRYENVYERIGMIWRGLENGAARYDFIVEPFADARQIALRFDGADSLEIDAEGNLLIHTAAGIIKQSKPFSYQETVDFGKIEIESGFLIEDKTVKFRLGDYDRSKALTIDPTVALNNLAFSTFLGSSQDDIANDLTVDAMGNVYVTGRTLSPAFPATAGAFDTSANGLEDVFVTKISGSGTGVIFSTFLGGPFYDEGRGIAVDAGGNIYLTGTASSGFPTTGGSYDTIFNGGADVFVTKLNPLGTALIYSTYIGASNIDLANDLAIDAGGNAYIVVRTSDAAVDYPTTAGAFDTTFNGFDDVAVTKLNNTGATLVYSTFLGGSSIDNGMSIAVNAAGEVYVGGTATDDATDFPTTAGSYDTTHNGSTDFFVTRINNTGSNLIFSTFIGGGGIDNANGLAIDDVGNAYIVGNVSAGFPTTAGVFDTTAAGGSEIGLSKISADGTALVYSTFLGGTQLETANAVAVDAFGNAYVTGGNQNGDYPTTAGAYDTTHNGTTDAILTVFNPQATALIYSTFLGGGGSDTANDVALDSIGNVYLAGQTAANASSFPTTAQAYQTFHGGAIDAFVSKFGNFAISGRAIDTSGNPLASVMVALSGQTSEFMLTGADGRFGFVNTVANQPATVSATRSGYSINPALFNIASLNNNRELVFVGAPGSPTGGSGGTLAFENLSYSKSENGASALLTVTRTGTVTTTEPVTVDFQTADGSAAAAHDYLSTSGVLTFNFGENSKTINVPLVNDTTLEPRETFTITLSNPTNNAEIQTNRASATVSVLDEDLSNGSLLISEFRQRGRLGANDEYVKLFNPNDFDITVNTADGSAGLTIGRTGGGSVTPIATIPNLVTIAARGHYLLTNNHPSGGFSLIDYPTGRGTTTAVGDQTFSVDIPDNSDLVLLKTAASDNFNPENLLDAVGFGNSAWTSEGKNLPAIGAQNSETCFVRKLTRSGLQDTNNNQSDFLLIDNQASAFSGGDQTKIYSALGAPAPETSESLRLMTEAEVLVEEFGAENYNSTPVPNGSFGTLTIYRRITNNTSQPIIALRLRAIDFPTAGSLTQRRYSSRPDFRLLSSADESAEIMGARLAAERLQPNGGGLNSTLTIDSVSMQNPLPPGASVVVAIKFGVMRYGRHPFTAAVEALQ